MPSFCMYGFGEDLDQLANLHSDTLRDLAPIPYGEV